MLPDRISRLLTAYVDGELGPRQRQAMVRWLRRSPEARALLGGLQKDAERLRNLPRQSLDQDFPQQVLQAIAHRQAESARRSVSMVSKYLPRWTVLAAAAALVALGLGSYFYFTAARPRRSEPLAVHIPRPERSLHVEQPAEPRAPASSPAQPNTRESLGPPALEIDSKSGFSAAIPPVDVSKTQAKPRGMPLGSPFGRITSPLKDLAEPTTVVFDFRELVLEKPKQQLNQALQKSDSHQIDVRCNDTRVGIERLRAAFGAQGIQLIMDQDAQALVTLGMGSDTPFAVYCEDMTAHEVVLVLEQLAKEDRKRFDRLAVSAMPSEGGRKLSYKLGLASAQWNAKGKLRLEAAKPGGAAIDRQALVVAYTPGRPRPTSAALKRFLENRKVPRAGTIQILLVLSSPKG